MDGFRALIQATKDYLITNGVVLVIVIFVTASMTTILGYAIPAFGRFVRYLPQRIWGRWKMFKKWWYWRRYHPNYTFTNLAPALINETMTTANEGPVYKIILEMRLHIHNNDDVNSLFLGDFGRVMMTLRMYSKTERRAKYTLFNSVTNPNRKVAPLKDKYFDFTLTTDSIDMKPKLGNDAYCDKIMIAIVQLDRMNYPLRGKPFNVKVDWSKIKTLEVQNDRP